MVATNLDRRDDARLKNGTLRPVISVASCWRLPSIGSSQIPNPKSQIGMILTPANLPMIEIVSQEPLRSLVWTDYRLAVLFTVLLPLLLLIWAFVRRAEAMQTLLIIYWRVSSLLAITVYLMIGGFPFSFLTAFFARILIPIGLWFWADLNEEITDQPKTPLKFVFTAWRWAVSVYCGLGAIATLPFLNCALSETALDTPACQVWLEAPLLFREYFHADIEPSFLGFALGVPGLIIYGLYLAYFVFVRLGKQGRTAVQQ